MSSCGYCNYLAIDIDKKELQQIRHVSSDVPATYHMTAYE